MLELRQFRQFVAVAEEMSFRRAAERLRMAQPPLTTAIKRIEEELGVVLLERSSRVTGLTEPGRAFLEEARKTIMQADKAVALARRAGAGLLGSLRVVFVPSTAHALLPAILRLLRNRYPGIKLELTEASTAHQTAALIGARADVGILVPPFDAPELMYETLVHDRLVVAMAKQHRLAMKHSEPVPLSELRNEQWILCPLSQSPGYAGRIIAACEQAGFAPRVVQYVAQMDTILGLAAGSLGIGLVPSSRSSLSSDANLAFREISGLGTPIKYELAAAWRATANDPALAAFVEVARSAASGKNWIYSV